MDVGANTDLDAVDRILLGVGGLDDLRDDHGRARLERLAIAVVLVLEVFVEGALGRSGALDDVGDRHRVEALFGDLVDERGQQATALRGQHHLPVKPVRTARKNVRSVRSIRMVKRSAITPRYHTEMSTRQ